MAENITKIDIYTDGAASKNGTEECKAGWSFVALQNGEVIKQTGGAIFPGTNNIGELTAILEAIKFFNSLEVPEKMLTIYSDSAYCVNGINEWIFNWKKNDWFRNAAKTLTLKNKEIWQEIDSILDRDRCIVMKVAGHSGDEWNELCDRIAKGYTK